MPQDDMPTQPEVLDSAAAATPNPEVETPSAESVPSSHGESEIQTEATADPEKSEEALRKEAGKLQQTQAELKKAREELQRSQEEASNYGQLLLSDEEIYRKALTKRGYSKEQTDKAVSDLKTQYPELAQAWAPVPSVPETPTAPVQPDIQKQIEQIPEIQELRKQREDKQKEEFDRFFAVRPELHPEKVEPERKREVGHYVVNELTPVAMMVAQLRQIPMSDALIAVDKLFTGNVKDIEEARKQERLKTIMAMSADKAASMSSGAPSNPASGSDATAEEREIMGDTGMTLEEVRLYTKKGSIQFKRE